MASSWPGSYNYIPLDAIELDWPGLSQMFNDGDGTNECMLVALPWRSISLLVSTLRFAEYWHLWGLPGDQAKWSDTQRQTWYEISAHITELEVCLMSGCSVADLIKTNRMLVAAVTGIPDNLDDPLPVEADYSDVALSVRLADIKSELIDANVKLTDIATAIREQAAGGAESLEDDLQNIKMAIEAIALIAAA